MVDLSLTPQKMDAIKSMCKNMIFMADNNPDYNHISVVGLFINGSQDHYPYAMIYIGCTCMSNEQLEKLVDICNTRTNSFRDFTGMIRQHLYKAFDDNELLKYVTVISGSCCDLRTRREIKMINQNY